MRFINLTFAYLFFLSKVSFVNISPNRNATSVILVFLYSFLLNLFYSYKNILIPKKFNQTCKKTGSSYWDRAGKHLRFLITYYSVKDYFCSPIIKLTASSNHNKLNVSKDFLIKNKIFINFAKILTENFSNINYNAVIRNLSVYKGIYSIKFIKKKLKKNFSCLEIGPGMGLNSFYYSTLNKNPIFFFDTPEMSFIQRKIYSCLLDKSRLNKVYFENNLKILNNKIYTKRYYISAFWSFSEFSLQTRIKFNNLIKKSQFSLFCFNENFEGIDNKKYFSELATNIGKKIKFFALKYYKMPKYATIHRICLIY